MGKGDDGKERAKCNGCGKTYVVGGKAYGTSHLNRHIPKCEKRKYEDMSQMILNMQGKLKSRKIDQMIFRELYCHLMIRHGFPFNFIESPVFKALITYLNPDENTFSKNTFKVDMWRIFIRDKARLKSELATIPNKICLTSDLWKSCNTEGFISLTTHYVDLNWKSNSKILNFHHMPPPHTGFELSKKIGDFLQDWGIEKKNFSITLDNVSANDVLQQTLKKQLVLQKGLICDGEFFHVRCCAHVLNLIVQEGLKVLDGTLDQIRTSIKYLRGSESRMIKFKKCLKKFSDINSSSALCLDVPTRWNSTFLMLRSALKYQRVFGSLHLVDENYKYCPSDEEWERATKICKFLQPFYEITTLISGTSYPTSNLYFLQVWKIQCLLMGSVTGEDKVVRDMELKMHKLQVANKSGRTQLDIYLDEPTLDLDFTEHMDILQWWKNNSQRFPDLSLMARDFLSIPITTVASESTFNIGSCILNKYRNRLLPENVEAIICVSSWKYGFNPGNSFNPILILKCYYLYNFDIHFNILTLIFFMFNLF
uniref:AC transposase n=1 Tax=Cajanus cajan TaxID=3821 RepID=A0A151RH96_CAJCA|nr:Putative AC transposase [Cajanus cajan]KYP41915.1 Putative AC transposase [Cajanus cajan]KYP41917.1 Putative AC transposase [Cajanus cajan]